MNNHHHDHSVTDKNIDDLTSYVPQHTIVAADTNRMIGPDRSSAMRIDVRNRRDFATTTVASVLLMMIGCSSIPKATAAAAAVTDGIGSDDVWQRKLMDSLQPATADMPQIPFPQQQKEQSSSGTSGVIEPPTVVEGMTSQSVFVCFCIILLYLFLWLTKFVSVFSNRQFVFFFLFIVIMQCNM